MIAAILRLLAVRRHQPFEDSGEDCSDFNEVRARPFGHGCRGFAIEPEDGEDR